MADTGIIHAASEKLVHRHASTSTVVTLVGNEKEDCSRFHDGKHEEPSLTSPPPERGATDAFNNPITLCTNPEYCAKIPGEGWAYYHPDPASLLKAQQMCDDIVRKIQLRQYNSTKARFHRLCRRCSDSCKTALGLLTKEQKIQQLRAEVDSISLQQRISISDPIPGTVYGCLELAIISRILSHIWHQMALDAYCIKNFGTRRGKQRHTLCPHRTVRLPRHVDSIEPGELWEALYCFHLRERKLFDAQTPILHRLREIAKFEGMDDVFNEKWGLEMEKLLALDRVAKRVKKWRFWGRQETMGTLEWLGMNLESHLQTRFLSGMQSLVGQKRFAEDSAWTAFFEDPEMARFVFVENVLGRRTVKPFPDLRSWMHKEVESYTERLPGMHWCGTL